MSHTLHIIFDENRHSLQQSQSDTPTQWGSFSKIDQIFQTKAQGNALRKFDSDIIGRIFRIIIRLQSNLSISDISLTREFDTSL